tara:strand:- start:391 stop:603 length:213 start_codon:yes stop_codon:yes gene_type:complete
MAPSERVCGPYEIIYDEFILVLGKAGIKKPEADRRPLDRAVRGLPVQMGGDMGVGQHLDNKHQVQTLRKI